MKNALIYERFLKHPPERVWKALTDRGWLAEWYMPDDFQPVVGHRFQFRTAPAPGFDFKSALVLGIHAGCWPVARRPARGKHDNRCLGQRHEPISRAGANP